MRALLGFTLSLALSAGSIAAQEQVKPAKHREDLNRGMGISGNASSATFCVAGRVARTHALGYVAQNARVTVTFLSDFDPVAVITLTQVGTQAPDNRARASFVADDDSGGNLEPEIRWTTSHSGTLVLHVRAYGENDSGCYHFKVEIQD